MTTKQDLEEWFKRGVKQGATHMIVVCDTYDHEDYPVYVMPEENVRKKAEKYRGVNMQTVMEVYSLKKDMKKQLDQHRTFDYD